MGSHFLVFSKPTNKKHLPDTIAVPDLTAEDYLPSQDKLSSSPNKTYVLVTDTINAFYNWWYSAITNIYYSHVLTYNVFFLVSSAQPKLPIS